MTYVDGFVLAVPEENKRIYREHAAKAAPLFKEFGATRMAECWGDNVPDGKVTDFRRAVKAKDNEAVLFSWIEYPSKEARDAANQKMMSDPRMEDMGKDMPFDGQRMIFGGFASMLDEGKGGNMGYADGFVAPVPPGKRQAYLEMATKAADIFKEHGATRVVETWSDDVPDGKVTDFKGAVAAEDGELIVYSWIEWPSKDARDRGWEKVMADKRMQPPENMPFDGKRMIYGGFAPVLDV